MASANLIQRVIKLEERIDRKAIYPPESLYPYLEEKKICTSAKEQAEVSRLFNLWMERIRIAVKRSQVDLTDILAALPFNYRIEVESCLREMIKNKSSEE